MDLQGFEVVHLTIIDSIYVILISADCDHAIEFVFVLKTELEVGGEVVAHLGLKVFEGRRELGDPFGFCGEFDFEDEVGVFYLIFHLEFLII